ncbi:MAG TPA: nuclear transport factor 2 family protein [Pyrinomonadaceae bacterium]|jgi:ketosteroid isomerase-like protein
MKKLSSLLLLVCVALVFGQEARRPVNVNHATRALQSMVDTERAFAKMSAEQGVRPAFVAFIADDGILFRPTAVNGKQWFKEHPAPASDKRPLLSWQPIFADISQATDMGYTTGPWQFKADINDAKPVAWGNFLTVWKRQADNSWRFVIDLGISNPEPDHVQPVWQAPPYRGPITGGSSPDNATKNVLLNLERQFSKDSATRGAQSAFREYAAGEVRLFRNGKQPFVGKGNAIEALPDDNIEWTWTPAFADMSRSRDFGYTYGTYQLVRKDSGEKVEAGNYYRIWKWQDEITSRRWKVVTDLLDPVKPGQ